MTPYSHILDQLNKAYMEVEGLTPPDQEHLPAPEEIEAFLNHSRGVLFPQHSNEITEAHLKSLGESLSQILTKVAFNCDKIIENFLEKLPSLRRDLAKDAIAHFNGDPAAKSLHEVLLAYPGFHAITIHRIAHFFYKHEVPLLPRLLNKLAHQETGIDIHPGAQIGASFCIDHGTGIVIGETAVLGENVKLYQGVTLGALSVPNKNSVGQRHPTIEDHVTIYSGATILGGETVIGNHCVIGGNVWIVNSIPAKSKVYLSSDQRQIYKMTPQDIETVKGWGI